MTVQRWEQEPLPAPSRDVVDGWAHQVAAVAALAARIAGTDFVGRGFRGSDAAVTAAILFGREIGVGPMTALQGIYVVNGNVAMRAQLMRALVLSRGHHLRIPKGTWTDASCTLVGRRAGESDETEVTWTIAHARQARLLGNPAWSNYPGAMLLARTTGQLCRAVFPDVIGGMTLTVEEAEDIPAAEQLEPAPTRTIRRRDAKTPPPGPVTPAPDPGAAPDTSPAAVAPPRPAAGDLPPLPDDTVPAIAPVGPVNGADTAERPTPDQPDPDASHDPLEPLSAPQRTHLFRLFGEAGRMEPRAERIRVITGLVHRRVESFNDLTRAEATKAIDALVLAEQSNDPAALDALVEAGWERLAEREHPALWEDEGIDE